MSRKQSFPWAKFLGHPVWGVMDERLQIHGFYRVSHWDEEGRTAHWVKGAFTNASFFISLGWSRPLEKNELNFVCRLGLESSHIQKVWNTIRIWECGHGMMPPDAFPFREPQCVVHLPLSWLMLNADPPVKNFTWRIGEKTMEDDVDLFMAYLTQHGFPFLAQIDTLEKTVRLLQNIDNYPRKTEKGGPGSAAPYLFAALLLHQNRQYEEAMKELEIHYKTGLARCERLWAARPDIKQEEIDAVVCGFNRHKRYIGGFTFQVHHV
jgi:hypothetical protein